MRNMLAAFFNFLAKTIAVLFAVLFVVSTVLVLLLLGVDHALLNTETYKRALAEQNVYERLPALVAEQFTTLESFLADPCAANPLGCAIDGASPELQACLTAALGAQAYEDLGTYRRSATQAELDASQPCLDQFGKPASSSEPDGGTGGPPAFLNNLSPDQWQQVIQLLLPPEELQQMTESTLDEVFGYLKGERDTASVSLVDLKARLAGETGRDLILLLVNAQPPCTDEEQARILAGDFGGEGEPQVVCAATGETLEKLQVEFQRQLNEAAEGIPDQATLIEPPSPSEPSEGHGPFGSGDPLTTIRMVRTAVDFSPLLPLALLLIVTLFGVRTTKGWLMWWGVPLFLSGLIVLVIGLAILPLLNWAWPVFVVPRIPTLFASSSLVLLSRELAQSVAREFAKWISLASGFLAALGLGAVVGAYFLKPKQKGSVPAEPPPDTESTPVTKPDDEENKP